MKAFVRVTDNDWFEFLSQQPGIDKINLWQQHATGQSRAKQRFGYLMEITTLAKPVIREQYPINRGI